MILLKNKWIKFLALFIVGYISVYSVNAVAGMYHPDLAIAYTFGLYLIFGFIFGRTLNANKLIFIIPVFFHFGLMFYLFSTAEGNLNELLRFMLPYLLIYIFTGFITGWFLRYLLRSGKKILPISIILICVFLLN